MESGKRSKTPGPIPTAYMDPSDTQPMDGDAIFHAIGRRTAVDDGRIAALVEQEQSTRLKDAWLKGEHVSECRCVDCAENIWWKGGNP